MRRNDNAARAKVGDELTFRVLFEGKPLTANVLATYAGFSRHHNTYAYATMSRDGIAHIRITHSGEWMVQVERRMEVTDKDYDLHVLKAVLVFPVE